MTIARLRERAGYWQERLNLREWSISVRWAAPKEAAGIVGACSWSTEELKAEILIVRRSNEHEQTLIHELLHLVIDGHDEYGDYNHHSERAINRITAALYDITYDYKL